MHTSWYSFLVLLLFMRLHSPGLAVYVVVNVLSSNRSTELITSAVTGCVDANEIDVPRTATEIANRYLLKTLVAPCAAGGWGDLIIELIKDHTQIANSCNHNYEMEPCFVGQIPFNWHSLPNPRSVWPSQDRAYPQLG